MSEQAFLAAVEAAWRRAAFRSSPSVDPWSFRKLFRDELALELAEYALEQRGYIL